MPILPILDEISAYLHIWKQITHFKTSSEKKFHFSTTGDEINAKFEIFLRNNCVFTKPNAKTCVFQKISWGKKKKEKCFGKISAFLQCQFKQKSRLSKNQPWKTREFCWFSPKLTYIYATNRKKRRELCRFSAKQTDIYTASREKRREFCRFPAI